MRRGGYSLIYYLPFCSVTPLRRRHPLSLFRLTTEPPVVPGTETSTEKFDIIVLVGTLRTTLVHRRTEARSEDLVLRTLDLESKTQKLFKNLLLHTLGDENFQSTVRVKEVQGSTIRECKRQNFSRTCKRVDQHRVVW